MPRRTVIALLARQNRGSEQPEGTELRTRRGPFRREEPGESITALREIFPRFPEAKQDGAEAKAPFGIPVRIR